MTIFKKLFKKSKADVKDQSLGSSIPVLFLDKKHISDEKAYSLLQDLIVSKSLPVHSKYKTQYPDLLVKPAFQDKILCVGNYVFVSASEATSTFAKSYMSICSQTLPDLQIFVINSYLIKTAHEEFLEKKNKVQMSQDLNEVQKRLSDIVELVASRQSSDLHITVDEQKAVLEYRQSGDLRKLDTWTREEALKFINVLGYYASDKDQTFNINQPIEAVLKPSDFVLPENMSSIRCIFSPTGRDTVYVVLRFLYEGEADTSLTLPKLGFNDRHQSQISEMRSHTDGIFIVTGPTGSGKSTSLKVNMEAINTHYSGKKNIIAVEDPREYSIKGVKQIHVNKGEFQLALKAALRQDPDFFMIGEIRDNATAKTALQAAITGHSVWSTLHVSGVMQVVERLISLEVDDYLACSHKIIKGFMSQRLVQVLCPACSLPAADNRHLLSIDEAERLEPLMKISPNIKLKNQGGCQNCRGEGVVSRTVLAETMITNHNLMSAFKEKDLIRAEQIWFEELDGQTMMEHGLEKVIAGQIDPREIESRLGRLEIDFDRLVKLGIIHSKSDMKSTSLSVVKKSEQ